MSPSVPPSAATKSSCELRTGIPSSNDDVAVQFTTPLGPSNVPRLCTTSLAINVGCWVMFVADSGNTVVPNCTYVS